MLIRSKKKKDKETAELKAGDTVRNKNHHHTMPNLRLIRIRGSYGDCSDGIYCHTYTLTDLVKVE